MPASLVWADRQALLAQIIDPMRSSRTCRDILAAAHNNCLKLALALLAASRDSQKKKCWDAIRGDVDMLDAIQISVALWAMIVCGGIKVAQVVHCLF